MHDPSFMALALIVFRENDLNTKKFTPPPVPEKQYICLASASQARQKLFKLYHVENSKTRRQKVKI